MSYSSLNKRFSSLSLLPPRFVIVLRHTCSTYDLADTPSPLSLTARSRVDVECSRPYLGMNKVPNGLISASDQTIDSRLIVQDEYRRPNQRTTLRAVVQDLNRVSRWWKCIRLHHLQHNWRGVLYLHFHWDLAALVDFVNNIALAIGILEPARSMVPPPTTRRARSCACCV